MDREKANKIIERLRDCEDLELSNLKAEREKIDGKQEGYQKAMFELRAIIREFIKEEKK